MNFFGMRENGDCIRKHPFAVLLKCIPEKFLIIQIGCESEKTG
jgi:hypothetical protein